MRRLVVTSTSEVYGTARFTPITEEHPLQPQSPYSASKIGADSLALSYHLSFGLPVITSRHNGASELLEPPHDGLVVRDPHDADELAGALTVLLDPARRLTCSRAALRAARRWTFDDHYRQLLKLLEARLAPWRHTQQDR